MAQNPLLDLDSAGNAETVIIDGTIYALTDFDSFSVIDQHKIQSLGRRTLKILAEDELSEPAAEELSKVVDELFERIAGTIPKDVKAKLRPGARMRITNAYFLAFSGAQGAEPSEATPSEDGSATQSLGSKDSTAVKSTPG
ncbi:hypothetical protein LCGC14_1258250 [marine sediment metagenome]|uniref:Uncharacterized protein n=1 Tax=marine sediment metagenome TaxID=412755 RepID=A0A0F9LMS2_9ZZZZ